MLILPTPVFAAVAANPAIVSKMHPADDTPVPVAINPVALPDPKLSDAEYKTALAALLANSADRPGVYASLANFIARDTPPPHASVIVELLSGYLATTNTLETVIPLKVLGRCGAAARPALGKVMTLASSKLAPVRMSVAECLGGMFYAAPATPTTAPDSVIKILLYMLRTDTDRGTRRAVTVALGRCRVATPDVVMSLASIAGGDDTQVSVGALFGVESLGPDARLALSAIKNRLADKETVANAATALIAVATPQEALDIMAETLTSTPHFIVRQAIVYYIDQLPKSYANPEPMAVVLKKLMEMPPAPGPDEKRDYSQEEAYNLRAYAAAAYQSVTGDTPVTIATLANITADSAAPAEVRRGAVDQIFKLSPAALKDPAVSSALQTALADTDSNLQGGVLAILFKYGSPAMKPFAPRVSQLLVNAWENKEKSRTYSLLNILYRIGPAAKTSAVPALKKMLAKEPKGSPNAILAQTVLEKVSG